MNKKRMKEIDAQVELSEGGHGWIPSGMVRELFAYIIELEKLRDSQKQTIEDLREQMADREISGAVFDAAEDAYIEARHEGKGPDPISPPDPLVQHDDPISPKKDPLEG